MIHPFLFSLLLALLLPQTLHAYECWDDRDAREILQDADVVFTGSVKSIEDMGISREELGTERKKITFDVDQMWKRPAPEDGSEPRDINTLAVDVESLYEYDFREKDSYLIYAYQMYPDRYTLVGCPRVKALTEAKESLVALGTPLSRLVSKQSTEIEEKFSDLTFKEKENAETIRKEAATPAEQRAKQAKEKAEKPKRRQRTPKRQKREEAKELLEELLSEEQLEGQDVNVDVPEVPDLPEKEEEKAVPVQASTKKEGSAAEKTEAAKTPATQRPRQRQRQRSVQSKENVQKSRQQLRQQRLKKQRLRKQRLRQRQRALQRQREKNLKNQEETQEQTKQ